MSEKSQVVQFDLLHTLVMPTGHSADREQSGIPDLSQITSLVGLDAVTAAHVAAWFEGRPFMQPETQVVDTSTIPSSVIHHAARHLVPGEEAVVLDPTTAISRQQLISESNRRWSATSDFNRP